MATAQLNRIAQHIRRTLTAQALGEATDAMLLERFTSQQDEAAFAVLVRRHGPMVLGVCRRLLHNLHDAEDAFQAAFLLLARKAGSVRKREALAGWLFAVSRRLALKLRAGADRRHAFEDQVKAMAPTETCDLPAFGPQQRSILDEELDRLPEKYRAALVVCYLEGKTRAEAARLLGWKVGAVKIRLERGRDLLRTRLTRRGLALSAGALATVLAEAGAASAVSPALVDATVQAAMLLGAGQAVLAGVVSEQTLALVEGMRKTMLLTKLKIATVVLIAFGLLGTGTAWLLHPTAAAQAPGSPAPAAQVPAAKQPAKDLYGDPLPPGARARLGTLRFRHESNVAFVAYTADGKHLITATENGVIRKWDAASGKEILQFGKSATAPNLGNAQGDVRMQAQMAFLRVRGATNLALALAPDGHTLVTARGNVFALFDVATGKQVRQWKAPNPVFRLVFAPDGKSLVSRGWVPDHVLRQWDVAEGKEIRKFGEQPKPQGGGFAYFAGSSQVAFSPDGKVVATQGFERNQNPPVPVVKRWEVASGKELPSIKGNAFESVTFAADGKTVIWMGFNPVKARLFDLEAGKQLREIDDMRLAIAFSPDGNMLVGLEKDQDLALWDTSTGKVRHKLKRESWPAGNFQLVVRVAGTGTNQTAAFSADGKHLAAGGGTVVRQWEVAGGKEINLSAGHTSTVSSVAFAADGKTVLTRGADNTLRRWDAAGRETQKLSLPPAFHAVFSTDGQTLVLGSKGTIHLWDAKAGKELRQWKAHDKGIGGLALSADGKLVASRSPDRTIRVWDAATGKEVRQIAEPGNAGRTNPGGAIFGGAFDSNSQAVIFSPDSATVAALPPANQSGAFMIVNGQGWQQRAGAKEPIRLWDVATGKLVRKFADPRAPIGTAVFSPDGRTLATANTDGTISLWETLSGKERLQWKSGAVGILTFSADGRFLVSGGSNGTIGFWDAATGKQLAQRKGHQTGVAGLALSADGKSLVSGSSDTTALIWDVPALDLAKLPAVRLESAQVDAFWNDLAGADPGKAYHAIRSLSAAPAQATPVLQDRLKPVPVPDPQRIAQLIADLDSKQFATRQKAEAELEKLGELADPALKQVLAGKPSLETRQRVEKLREKLVTGEAPTAEVLRALRALAVLEEMGTTEARQLLEKLSQGAPGAKQTREAKAVLARLAKRSG